MKDFKWMRTETGTPVKVEEGQIEEFKKRGYMETYPPELVVKNPESAPNKHAPRFSGEAVLLYKGGVTCKAFPSQVDQLKRDGWSLDMKGDSNVDGKQQQGGSLDQAGSPNDERAVDPKRVEQQPGAGSDGAKGSDGRKTVESKLKSK